MSYVTTLLFSANDAVSRGCLHILHNIKGVRNPFFKSAIIQREIKANQD